MPSTWIFYLHFITLCMFISALPQSSRPCQSLTATAMGRSPWMSWRRAWRPSWGRRWRRASWRRSSPTLTSTKMATSTLMVSGWWGECKGRNSRQCINHLCLAKQSRSILFWRCVKEKLDRTYKRKISLKVWLLYDTVFVHRSDALRFDNGKNDLQLRDMIWRKGGVLWSIFGGCVARVSFHIWTIINTKKCNLAYVTPLAWNNLKISLRNLSNLWPIKLNTKPKNRRHNVNLVQIQPSGWVVFDDLAWLRVQSSPIPSFAVWSRLCHTANSFMRFAHTGSSAF